MKIVLIGAGSAQFGYGTLGEIFQSKILTGSEIVLVDINGEALNKVYKEGLAFIENHNLDFTLDATTDRVKAFNNADFIIISIEIGDRFELWDMDWKVPLQYGIRQIYGENGGPGGVFHALRIIPPILDICGDAVSICPKAVVLNYSNPMSAITTTVLRKYPDLKFIGMCHEVSSLNRYLPGILKTNSDNLELRAAGLNHFGVLIEARYRDTGRDAYPDILEKAPLFFEKEPGFSDVWDYVLKTGDLPKTEGANDPWGIGRTTGSRPWMDRTLFKEILEKYRLLPITVDSHLGEYISWAHDVADHRGILDFYSFYRYALSKRTWAEIKMELRERIVPVMEGIAADSGVEEKAVNILNNGSIPDFPDSVAVEVPAVIDKRGATGIKFKTYPKGFGALIRNYAGVYDLTAEAVLTGKKEYVIQAILASPATNVCRGVPEMVDQMLFNQRQWLQYIR